MKQIIVEVINPKEEKGKNTKLRAAAYCRVSTLKDEQELSYERLNKSNSNWTEYCVRYRLKNESYKGDLLIPKTYSPSLLCNKRYKNKGNVTQFYIEDHHELKNYIRPDNYPVYENYIF